MILIADSGSTKTDWVIVEANGARSDFSTMGFNPFLHSVPEIIAGIKSNESLVQFSEQVSQVYYYGAGCSSDELRSKVSQAIRTLFVNATVNVRHDTLAAAYATYSGEVGVSCILGTGSNSCLFDGAKSSEVVPALGFILGDEGSGSYLGKRLLRDFAYNKMPRDISQALQQRYQLTTSIILDNVLSKPKANVYLASFANFLSDHRDHEYVQEVLHQSFLDFLNIHVTCFDEYQSIPVHFVGSIAFYYKQELVRAATSLGISVGNVIQKPIDGLVKYHQG